MSGFRVPLKLPFSNESDTTNTKSFQQCNVELESQLDPSAPEMFSWPITFFAKKDYDRNKELRVSDLDFEKWQRVLTHEQFGMDFREGEDNLQGWVSFHAAHGLIDGGRWGENMNFRDIRDWREVFSQGLQHGARRHTFEFKVTGTRSSVNQDNSGKRKRGDAGTSVYSDGDPGPSKRPRESGDDIEPIGTHYEDDDPHGSSDEDMSDVDPNDLAGERELEGGDDFDANDLEGTPQEIREQILTQQINKIKDSQAVEQFDDATWQDCCNFFRQDHTNHSRDIIFDVRGLVSGFRVYQAYAIYVMMLRSRGLSGGGFLCDEQGLGKTREGLGFCIMEHILTTTWDIVRNDQRKKLGQHNSAETAKTAMSCPSEVDNRRPFAIPCPCWQGSITSKLAPKQGPSLILAPPGLLKAWGDEFQKLTGNPVVKGVSTSAFINLVLLHADYPLLPAVKPQIQKWLNNSTAGGGAKSGLTRYIAVTAPGSFKGQVGSKKMWGDGSKDSSGKTTDVKNVWWGRVLRDEFHMVKTKDKQSVNLVRDLKGNPHTWLLSGTPFERSPKDLDGYMDILRLRKTNGTRMNMNTWVNEPWKYARTDEFDSLIKEYESEVKNKKQTRPHARRQLLEQFGMVLKAFMIRRVTKSKWFGEFMILLKPHWHHRPVIEPNPEYQQYEDDIRLQSRAMLENNSTISIVGASRMLRLTATFPALARIIVQEMPAWTMTHAEIMTKRWYLDEAGSPYARYLDKLINNSNKMRRLERILRTVSNGRNHEKKAEKVIILSTFPSVVFILYLWLKPKNKVLLIHGGTSRKNAYLDGFQVEKHSQYINDKNHAAKYSEGLDATILLSTPPLIGTGYTLTRSFRVILMEPAWMRRDEEQGYSRVKRIGQLNKRTHSYRLVNKGSLAEKVITDRQRTRGNISRNAFNMPGDPPAASIPVAAVAYGTSAAQVQAQKDYEDDLYADDSLGP